MPGAKGKTSAGLLVYRRRAGAIEVFIVHPGGPFFAKKDLGAWSLPKGLLDDGEDAAACARREFQEEVGQPPPAGPLLSLGEVRLKSGKRVVAFAAEGDVDADALQSNTFTMVWPPRSGREQTFPEVDRGAWLRPDAAKAKLNAAQAPLVDRLLEVLARDGGTAGERTSGDGEQTPGSEASKASGA